MNTTIQRPEDKVLDLDLETEVLHERGVTAPAIFPWSQETVASGPFSREPAPQMGTRLERWIRGSFLRWFSLILFLVLLDVAVLLPLLTLATH